MATTDERFDAKVRRGPDCWEWTGARTAPGWHGIFAVVATKPVVKVVAHRYAWERSFGPVSAGLSVLHACDNPACVRPEHLMIGTQAANMRDASRKGRMARTPATTCKRGHSFEGNTYIHPATGRRSCHQCILDRSAARRAKGVAA